jgi:hypothetical protein
LIREDRAGARGLVRGDLLDCELECRLARLRKRLGLDLGVVETHLQRVLYQQTNPMAKSSQLRLTHRIFIFLCVTIIKLKIVFPKTVARVDHGTGVLF